MPTTSTDQIQDQVRDRYAAAARAVSSGRTACCGDAAAGGTDCCSSSEAGSFGPGLYPADELVTLPQTARDASLGCGNPLAVADLHSGETILDLGSGGGGDVLLSARRVGPTGRVYGLDMTDEMLELARRNATEAGVSNVEFRKGRIEDIPLPEASVDVVISNCVINLSTDKPAVFAQMHRVLRPGGRVGVTDVVAEDTLTPAERAERGDWVGCVAGALSRSEYVDGLTAAGFTGVEVSFTHQVAEGMHSAIIRATRT
ncbi:MAG: arsenite methyltransferase [Micromonosporaceae bacterium]|nr:arsenite methyltransferase [Micromonosporaceae bacterium]